MCEITVKFNDVDESLGLSNYTETIEAGYGVTVTIDIPIGYVYDNFSARVGDYNLDWTVKVSDPTIEPEYEYTVARTITVKIDRVNSDHDIDIDMSGVRIKKLKVNVAQDILDNSITEDKDKNRYSNLKIVTLNPDYLSNLMYLKGDAITGQHNVSVLGEAYIEYLREYFPNRKEMYAGKGIGEIMHWLDKKLGSVKESLSDWLGLYSNNESIEKYIE